MCGAVCALRASFNACVLNIHLNECVSIKNYDFIASFRLESFIVVVIINWEEASHYICLLLLLLYFFSAAILDKNSFKVRTVL